MSGPLGEKVPPKQKEEGPQWRPHPTDKRFEVDRAGRLRTAIPPPPPKGKP